MLKLWIIVSMYAGPAVKLWIIVLLSMYAGPAVQGNSYGKKLFNDVMLRSGYNKHIRPVHNKTDIVRVSIGLSLSQLIDVVSAISKSLS